MSKPKSADDGSTLVNLDAESFVLGHIFKTSSDPEMFSRVSELVGETAFTLEKHRLIYLAMRDVFNSGRVINYGSVLLELQKQGNNTKVTGLIDVADGVPEIHNIESFCAELRECERLRTMRTAFLDAQARILSREVTSDALTLEIEGLLTSSQYKNKGSSGPLKPSEILERAGGLPKLVNPVTGPAIMTPWKRMNKYTGGMRGGQLWVMGGMPGTGKTSAACDITASAVFEQYKRVRWFSREMLGDELLFRMACTRANLDSQRVRSGDLDSSERLRFQQAIGDWADVHDDFLEIDDDECSTTAAMAASLRRSFNAGRPIDLCIVDFIQLLNGVGRFKDKREEMDQIAYGLKGIAKTFRIPVLALSQLNVRKLSTGNGAPGPNVKARGIEAPSMGDFRESAAVEQSADLAMIFRLTDVEQQYSPTRLVDLYLVKQRAGRTGKIPFKFHATTCTFEEIQFQHNQEAA